MGGPRQWSALFNDVIQESDFLSFSSTQMKSSLERLKLLHQHLSHILAFRIREGEIGSNIFLLEDWPRSSTFQFSPYPTAEDRDIWRHLFKRKDVKSSLLCDPVPGGSAEILLLKQRGRLAVSARNNELYCKSIILYYVLYCWTGGQHNFEYDLDPLRQSCDLQITGASTCLSFPQVSMPFFFTVRGTP